MADLAALEAPFVAEANARSALGALQALAASTPHAGAKAAIEADIPAAQKALDDAVAARIASGVTPQMIDQAAQAAVDARAASEEPTNAQPA